MGQTFSQKVKDEIIKTKLNKQVAINLLNGILVTQKQQKNYSLIINNKEVREFIEDILKTLNIEFKNSRKNCIIFQINQEFYSLDYVQQKDFFAAIFLVSGSVSDVNSTSYHLELKTKEVTQANLIMSIMNKYNIAFKLTTRKTHYLLYLKKVEQICDFLKAIGAINSYLAFEEKKIDRDYTNSINRLTNFDFYNQEKIAQCQYKFETQYNWVKNNGLLHKFTDIQNEFFEIKMQNQGSSLSDLVSLLAEKGYKKTKSTLNHYLKKLDKVYNEFKDF